MPSSIFWVIVLLYCHSDRQYDPDDYSVPIVFQHHQAKMLVYVPPGRQTLVAFDLKSMSLLGAYKVIRKIEFPKTVEGTPARIWRLQLTTLHKIPEVYNIFIDKNKKIDIKECICIVFNTREVGLISLRYGDYFFLNNNGSP